MPSHVLVIDDSIDIHRLLRVTLRRDDVVVLGARRPDKGLAAAVERSPDAILLDIDMPSESGFDVCRKLKADPRTRAIPVIFLTAAQATFAKVQALDLGAVDYVTKPFDVDELRARVRVALREKRERDALAVNADVDALSALGNRRMFERHLAARIAANHARGEDTSLVMADLDHFKAINDRFGHLCGDRVIQGTAAVLADSVRPGDVACRIGGEEFALLLAETPLVRARRLAERLRARLASTEMEYEGSPLKVTASFGVTATSLFRGRWCTAEAMLAAADDALYEAKQAGRDCVREAGA